MRRANDPDAHRFRSQLRGGARAVRSLITTIAAPRSLTTGGAAVQQSGRCFSLRFPASGIPTSGIPATGDRHAVWGLFAWDSPLDFFGA